MIDLHCHSSFSDGLLKPEELVEQARSAGISVLSLTDHDTVEGSKKLMEMGQSLPFHLITGVEFSVRWKKYDIHILGYQIDYESSDLKQVLEQQRMSRYQRAQEIAKKIELLGAVDVFNKALKIAGSEHLARPHFAQLLIEEGIAKDAETAFRRYLGRGQIAYVPTAWLSIEEAVTAILAAKGQAVLAHPIKYRLTRTKLAELITEFKHAGGIGLEVVSGEMTESEVKEMAGLSLRYGLLASSGSDYHGEGRSRVRLGRQRSLPAYCQPIWQEWTI